MNLSRSQAEKIFYSKFKPFVKELGFHVTDKKLSQAQKDYDWGWVNLDVSFAGHNLMANIFCVTRINKIEELVEEYIGETSFFGRQGNFSTFYVPEDVAWPEVKENKMRNHFQFGMITTEESVLEFFDLYTFMIKEKILPTREKWQQLKVMDSVLQGSDNNTAMRIFGSTGDFFLRKIIIPKLAGNPDYEKIYTEHYNNLAEAAKTESDIASYLPALEKLHERLKTVEPER
jgi:hypothetical protein